MLLLCYLVNYNYYLGKYMRIGYENGKGKTRPTHPIAIPTHVRKINTHCFIIQFFF